ncbi:unnamed protein product, partial [Leptidea sinapis]
RRLGLYYKSVYIYP